jgi:hypothetical protein
LPREDADLRRGLALVRLRDFIALRVGFLLAALPCEVFFVRGRAGAGLTMRATAFFAAGARRRSLAAFPAIAPTIPPTTAPAGPTILPSAAPATAPAVSLGIGGISMFSCAFGSSGIIGTPSLERCSFMYFAARMRHSRDETKKRSPRRPLSGNIWINRAD